MHKDSYITIRDTMRAQDVTRWQIVRTTKQQTVAEHSWAVAMIAEKIWLGYNGGSPADAATQVELGILVRAAMWHDVPEVFTGDINTPAKTLLKQVKGVAERLDEYERTAGAVYCGAMDSLTVHMKECLKLADFIEAVYFLEEYGVGSYASGQCVHLIERLYEYMENVDLGLQAAANRVFGDICDRHMETTSFQRVDLLGDA